MELVKKTETLNVNNVPVMVTRFWPKNIFGKLPGVTLIGGFSTTMDGKLTQYAEEFAKSNMISVIFDFKNFGYSGGEPRQFVSIPSQIEDINSVIKYALSCSDAEVSQMGLWGSSLGGSLAIRMASSNINIKAIVAQCPLIDLRLFTKITYSHLSERQIRNFRRMLFMDNLFNRFPFLKRKIPIMASKGISALPDPESYLMKDISGPSWRDEILLKTFTQGNIKLADPATDKENIDIPMLIQVAENDKTVSNQGIYNFVERYKSMVALEMINCGHFSIYFSPHFEICVKSAIKFLHDRLI